MSHVLCQWCKLLVNLSGNIEYGGKFYHSSCFDNLVKVAHRRGGAL